MAGIKRHRDGAKSESVPKPASPYMAMFELFRTELDEHHDRREIVIKGSRDITASSKKVIFSLQRVPTLGEKLSDAVLKGKDYSQHTSTIRDRFETVAPHLNGINAYRYQRQISPGIQEFMEAVLFQHFLETQTLLSPEASAESIPTSAVLLTHEDYLLGLFDMTGELMKYAITHLATSGDVPLSSSSGKGANLLNAMQCLRTDLEALNVSGSFGLSREVERKMATTRASVEKVENSMYSMTVRGTERPKGWNPGFDVSRDVAEVNC